MKIGQLCIKISGRDAGKKCVVLTGVEKNNLVLVDGETRRRKCNIAHLEPLSKVLPFKENASHKEVVDLFKKELKITIKEKKSKPKKERPKRTRKQKVKPEPKKPKKEKKAKQKTASAEIKKKPKESVEKAPKPKK
ncbi:hypothetical protein GF371_02295 [Candidatus Woesearchaeota archaeon]|nr:hypothetical protein [Candidatus Woesearchaeota archaeon]